MNQPARRALIVEDDYSWQQILAEILSDLGLVVDVAGNYEMAVGLLRTAPHRIAVVDLSLGGSDYHNQDGLRVLDAVHRHDPGCVPIMLTGFATVELAVSILTERRAYTCLRKEAFRRAEFSDLVRSALTLAPGEIGLAEEDRRALVNAASRLSSTELVLPVTTATALVVDDDPGWREILAEILGEAGIEARLCSSYGEALGCMRRGEYRLAVVDLSLASSLAPAHNLDGHRVLASATEAGIHTIVVSGAGTPEIIEQTYRSYSIFAYFEKEAFDRDTFRRTVTEALAEDAETGGGLAMLTAREREVLGLLAQGLTNKEIAAALVITTNTVKDHLKTIFEKLAVNTRSAAAAKAISGGLNKG